MTLEIRPYQEQDLAGVAVLMADLGYPTTEQQMRERMNKITSTPTYRTFVALLHNQVVGMVGIREMLNYEEDGAVTQISSLVTHHEFQGQGIGRALVRHVERWAEETQSRTLYLTSGIKPERERAHAFYKELGFAITGYRFVKKITE